MHTARPTTTASSRQPHVDKQAPPSQESTRALQWLSQHSADIMDACLVHLSGAESAALSGPWIRAAEASRSPRNLLTARLAASSHHHLTDNVVSGPLRQAIVTGLNMSAEAAYDASNWLRVPQWRDALFAERNNLHNELEADAYCPHQDVPQDNTTAVLALDKLNQSSPLLDADWAAMGMGRPPWQQQQDRRISGYEALLLASSFSAPMQGTLLARVIVGTALAYVGLGIEATAVVREAVQVQLPQLLARESSDAVDRVYGPLRGHGTAPGQQAMVWLKAAALAADAPDLVMLQLQGSTVLQPLGQRPVACQQGRRWKHLEQPLPLDHANFRFWCQEVGMDALNRFFTQA